jgi:hypothetical protein
VIGAAAIGERLTRRGAVAAMPGVPASAVAGVAPAPAAAPVAPSGLTRAALSGVLIICGAVLLGSIFHRIGLGAIGTLLIVLSWITFSGVTMIGAGAWLRAEFQAGTLTRLWGNRRKAGAPAPAAAAATPEAGSTSGVASPPAEPPVNPAGA